MHILLTRPRPESDALAAELRALGHEVTIEPMLEIVGTGETPSFDGVQAVLATSANGIRALAPTGGRRDIPVFAVGEATARAARDAGWVRVESANGASAALFRLVTERLRPDDGALLHVRGRDAAGDLAGTLAESGFEVRTAVLYAAEAAKSLSPAVRVRIAVGEIDVILFFSPRTAKTFVKLAADANIGNACTAIDAVCISPAVADAVAPLAWRGLHVAASPDQAAMIEECKRMQASKDSDKATGPGESPNPDKPQSDQSPSPSTLEKAIARDARDRNPDDRKSGAPETGDEAPDASAREGGTETAPRSSRGASFGLVGVLVVLLVLAAAYIAWPLWGPAMPGWLHASLAPVMEAGRGSGMADRVDDLSVRLAGLQRDLAAARSEIAARPRIDPARLSALDDSARGNADRIKAMENDVAALRRDMAAAGQSKEVASLARRVAEAEASIAALAAKPGTADAVQALDSLRTQSSARMTVLERENAAMRKLIAAQDDRLAALEKRPAAVAGTTRTNALVIAVGQLREAARGSAPFDEALATVKALAADDAALRPGIAELTPLAAAGVPDLTTLRLRFERIARRIAHEAYVPKGDGWLDRTLQQLSRLVSVRRSGTEAASRDDENGRVARAELRLAAGDLAGAVAALDALSGRAAGIAAPWLGEARSRLKADRAVERLFAEALRRTTAAGRDAPGG